MERIRVFAAAFLLAASLWGCANSQKTESVAAPATYKTADEIIEEAEAREKEEALSKAENLYGETAGVYSCASEGVDEQYWPSLELALDGTAVFHANLFTGMGELRGRYTVDSGTIKFSVEEVSFTGFVGETVTDMVFGSVSDDTLELSYTTPDTPVGVTNSGDRFTKVDAD